MKWTSQHDLTAKQVEELLNYLPLEQALEVKVTKYFYYSFSGNASYSVFYRAKELESK